MLRGARCVRSGCARRLQLRRRHTTLLCRSRRRRLRLGARGGRGSGQPRGCGGRLRGSCGGSLGGGDVRGCAASLRVNRRSRSLCLGMSPRRSRSRSRLARRGIFPRCGIGGAKRLRRASRRGLRSRSLRLCGVRRLTRRLGTGNRRRGIAGGGGGRRLRRYGGSFARRGGGGGFCGGARRGFEGGTLRVNAAPGGVDGRLRRLRCSQARRQRSCALLDGRGASQ